MDHIYLEKSIRQAPKAGHSGRSSRDVFRHMTMLRIPLAHQGNWALWNATHPERELSTDEGIVMHLIEAMRRGELTGRHPADLTQPYDFFDLIYDMIEWQDISLEEYGNQITRNELDWFGLNETVDLIVDEGFSSQNSRSFLRIRFVRVIWYDPMSSKGAHVVAIFRYQDVKKLFDTLECKLSADQTRPVSASSLLEMRRFQSQAMPVADDPTQILPRSDTPRPKPPLWWKP